jgi:hypothetical protein
MFNTCPGCGEWEVEKAIDEHGPFAVCSVCGHRQSFLLLPLYRVVGASASGKSTICRVLMGRVTSHVVLEADVLWRAEFDTPSDEYRAFTDAWLRLVKNIAQSGRPVALFGGGVPGQIERSPERRYVGHVHYLALVCDDTSLIARLQERLAWRRSAQPEIIERELRYNGWLQENAALTDPPMTLLDTSATPLDECAERVERWLRDPLAR